MEAQREEAQRVVAKREEDEELEEARHVTRKGQARGPTDRGCKDKEGGC
jgi:hypothetical protein